MNTTGDHGLEGRWREFRFDEVVNYIRLQAGHPDLSTAHEIAQRASKEFSSVKIDFLSILEGELSNQADRFLERTIQEADKVRLWSIREVIDYLSPKGQTFTRDTVALQQSNQAPPHVTLLAEVISLRHSIEVCRTIAEMIVKVASHLERQSGRKPIVEGVRTRVFIGHGRSTLWREFKDLVHDRLRLPRDEFNRVPAAGMTNIDRFTKMLETAAIAFLIMTAEDGLVDGGIQARMNVVHEAGLFQGKLGFTKAIIPLEEGCAEFSNIQGLVQIRFPKGNISAIFEQVRGVLEREGLIAT